MHIQGTSAAKACVNLSLFAQLWLQLPTLPRLCSDNCVECTGALVCGAKFADPVTLWFQTSTSTIETLNPPALREKPVGSLRVQNLRCEVCKNNYFLDPTSSTCKTSCGELKTCRCEVSGFGCGNLSGLFACASLILWGAYLVCQNAPVSGSVPASSYFLRTCCSLPAAIDARKP